MPEHIRALIVILFMSFIGFAVAKKVLATEVDVQEFKIWQLTWFTLTIAAFLAGNYWGFIAIAGALLIFISRKAKNQFAVYIIALFALPPMAQEIPGLGLVNYIINLNYLRFLALVVLLPLVLNKSSSNLSFFKVSTDKFIFLYILLLVALELRDTTFTDALRRCVYAYIDIFLPYYVASRYLKNLEGIKSVATSFVTISLVIALISIFEVVKGWLLYRPLYSVLATTLHDQVLVRSGFIRAMASLGQPIVLGYFMAIALGFYLFLNQSIIKKSHKIVGFSIIMLGLYAPASRGPWVGAAAMLIILFALSPAAIKKLTILVVMTVILIPSLTIIPGGEKVLNLIPFYGETEVSTIGYRQLLFKNAIIVIERYPLFGSTNYILEPEMQPLLVNGFIDIVNSYIRIALETGLIGLLLFISSFVTVIFGMYKQMRRIKDKKNLYHVLLRSMIAILSGVMLIIATVSSIFTVPTLYWILIGLGVASTEISKNKLFQTYKKIA